jgi:hypothetical protein
VSGIGNRSALRALGTVLQVEDVKQAPQELDTSTVKVVAGLDPGMMGGGQVQLVAQGSVAGLTGASWLAIGPPTFSPAPASLNSSLSTIRQNAQIECVILGLRIEVGFVEPIAAGDLSSLIEIREFRQAAENTASVVRLSSFRGGLVVDPLQDRYIWSYPMWMHARMDGSDAEPFVNVPPVMAASPIYVPAGSVWGLEVQFWEKGMSALRAFPVGTTIDVQGFVVTCPKGMRPPGM